jgi:hypothetical protein
MWTDPSGERLEKGGHRVFTAEDGRLAIADNSGRLPETTEDGILWLPEKEVHIEADGDRLWYSVAVSGDCGQSRVGIGLEAAARLTRAPYLFKVNAAPRAFRIGKLIVHGQEA